jgi:ABC-type taurine transport system ATPase subunit
VLTFSANARIPSLTVLASVDLGLTVRGIPQSQAKPELNLICMVRSAVFETAHTRQPSGGRAQSVGMARALTVNPRFCFGTNT